MLPLFVTANVGVWIACVGLDRDDPQVVQHEHADAHQQGAGADACRLAVGGRGDRDVPVGRRGGAVAVAVSGRLKVTVDASGDADASMWICGAADTCAGRPLALTTDRA